MLICAACLMITKPNDANTEAVVQVSGTGYCRDHGKQAMDQPGGGGRPLRMRQLGAPGGPGGPGS